MPKRKTYYGRRSSHRALFTRGRPRRRLAARRIQRAFRTHRRGRQRYSRTKNVLTTSLGRFKRRTVKTRLKALEAGSSKHWDYVSTGQENLLFNGTSLQATRNSYSSILAIQGPLCDGTAGNVAITEQEQRMNDVIFCKGVRIRGMLSGVRPKADLNPDSPGGTDAAVPPAPPAPTTMTQYGAEMMKSICQTRMWITLLVDKRPSVVGADGQSIVNPLPTAAGETMLETVYEGNLSTLGIEACLRSYQSSRFKVVHQECIVTSMERPHAFFDIKYKINKTLKYVVPRTAVAPAPPPANPPAFPYNYNLLCVFSVYPPVVPITWANSLSEAQLSRKSSRTYFTDA